MRLLTPGDFQQCGFPSAITGELSAVDQMAASEKDLYILLLGQVLRIVERKQRRGSKRPRRQKVLLAVLTVRPKKTSTNTWEVLDDNVRLFKPPTLLGGPRELVRRE